MGEACERAKAIIEKNADAMTVIINALIENEHLSGSEFERLLNGEADWKDKKNTDDKTGQAEEAAPENQNV